ncbi:MAG: hypothetical protein E7469_03450 [Ruminococcaceae bacterium]|nr:hypothetical protein [Oscillospiraceae bacterium]
MRFAMIHEADGSAVRQQCSLCGDAIYVGEDYYQVNGQVFCESCLEDYARAYFAPFLCAGGQREWK